VGTINVRTGAQNVHGPRTVMRVTVKKQTETVILIGRVIRRWKVRGCFAAIIKIKCMIKNYRNLSKSVKWNA
jgi:hypothetical protein